MPDNRRHPRRPQESVEQRVLLGVGRGLGAVVMSLFKALRGTQESARQATQLLDARTAQAFSEHWQAVLVQSEQAATQALAISEADKLFDNAMRAVGIPGETMGERLKQASPRFSESLYQDIWNAHKLRNRLAHEVGVRVTAGEVQSALTTFQRALRELGVFV